MKAITPAEAQKYRQDKIPNYIYEAFNTLIKKEFNGRTSLVWQDDVIGEILSITNNVSKQFILDNGWLDIEFKYIEAGWLVKYSTEGVKGPYFRFTEKPND